MQPTAETTRADIEREIARLNGSAKLCKHVVGNGQHETPWDRVHRRIDGLLEALGAAD